MNEAPEEVIFFGQEKNRFEKKSCKTGHNRCVYAYVNSKEEATALYREEKEEGLVHRSWGGAGVCADRKQEQEKSCSRAEEHHRKRPGGMECHAMCEATGKSSISEAEGFPRFLKSISTEVQANPKGQRATKSIFEAVLRYASLQ